ncbi:MAG TPA: thioesterase family protein [Jatrophihabitans sp.]|nr:thioesterase family protein [Jatrophihabitans sp.]
MADSYFRLGDETPSTGSYDAGPATVGPWDHRYQHGGPPTALAVLAAQRLLRHETERSDLVALRMAADFLGAVPVAEVTTSARVLRAGRSAALVEVRLAAAGRDCLLVRVWFVRAADTESVAQLPVTPPAIPDAPQRLERSFGYGESLDWRFLSGRMSRPGPAAAWVRAHLPLVVGQETPGLAHVALIADSASGISSELDWAAWSFQNVDLDIHLVRPVEGEWILLDAVTQLGPRGSALARSTLSDTRGVVGAGLQTLVVAPMSTGQ